MSCCRRGWARPGDRIRRFDSCARTYLRLRNLRYRKDVTVQAPPAPPAAAQIGERRTPIYSKSKGFGEQAVLYVFVIVPFLALLSAVPLMWGWGLGWLDVALLVVMFAITGHGITVGFHRHFTHGSFKAVAPLRAALVVAGSMAIQGPVTQWVADHRRHHAFSDREGDPHSPWRYGSTLRALTKGSGPFWAWPCRPCWADSSRCPGRVRCRASSGADSYGSPYCTT